MGKTLCFCGKKGSGKNTLSNFLHGYQIKALEKIEGFDLDLEGRLIVSVKDEDGKVVDTLINVESTDVAFAEWASYNMWPFVKQYSFASALKEICVGLFNIEPHKIYGTQDQKNELTHIRWEDMPCKKPKGKKGFMTGREFMQFFGTDVMRKIYSGVWINRTLTSIKEEDSQLSIITDGRFNNEKEAVQEAGGKTIYLTKTSSEDGHASENGLTPEECDAVIDNKEQTVLETCQELIKILDGWGWMDD